MEQFKYDFNAINLNEKITNKNSSKLLELINELDKDEFDPFLLYLYEPS